ncbi:unnamed protein product [Phyllotreta striolata]|uniref:Tubulin-specific chaperone E n=1 Tax=Phyllotreta striolata TaxID=444603 RepID=A0A9P0DU18_PHYSR|nr:unnamed protein product [Phyllotreta striolata]
MVAQSSRTEQEIGKRVDCGGCFGTVKYVGPVEGYPGAWLGVDWDDEERGKHDGRVDGTRYFYTRLPKSGSLVRPEKVNFGQSLLDAIKSKYGHKCDESIEKESKMELLKFQQQINAPFLEFVGFEQVAEKQRDLSSLHIVNVRLQNVSSIGEVGDLCTNIREIDLSKNLLSNWTDVFDMCAQLKHLFWLNLSENLLSMPDSNDKPTFPNVTVLICGFMELEFHQIEAISSIFPNVEELRVPYNHVTDLSVKSDHNFKRLKYLDLEGNSIKSWSEIRNLSLIESLEHLTIENTELDSIQIDDRDRHFRNLETLNINNNLISEWRSVGELNKLENLQQLRFLKNPVLELENAATREQIIIARIKSLKNYNGRQIRDDERRGAEYDYIKKHALEWMKCDSEEAKRKFLDEHNRFAELIESNYTNFSEPDFPFDFHRLFQCTGCPRNPS